RLSTIACPDADGGTQISEHGVTIDLDAGEALTCIFTNKTKHGIAIIKSANVTIASVGQTITYTYRVINDSQEALSSIVAFDDELGDVPLDKTTLAPDEAAIGRLSYTVVTDDLPGPLVNTV